MKKKGHLTLFLLCIAIISITDILSAQCATANSLQHRGGAITCQFPFLHQDDINHYVNRLETTDLSSWLQEKNETASRSNYQWKTKNLRVLLLTNHADIISVAQIEKLKLAMNLHLVDIAKANNSNQLNWANMPIVEEIIIKEYPKELASIFDFVGYLVFSDPDIRNGDTELNKLVRQWSKDYDINTIINLMDAPLDIPFSGSAQIYCSEPGEFMTVSIKKNNTISLADKYLVQFAQACVHTISHTNYANHQKTQKEDEKSLMCIENNNADGQVFETMMFNGTKDQKLRPKKTKPFGKVWSESNANQIIDTYIQRGLLLPLFDYENQTDTDQQELIIEEEINLFPNPVDEILTIEVENDIQYDLSVYNTNGKLIQKQTIESFVTQLDVSNYDSGIYIFEFYCANSGKRVTKKIEKIK